MGNRVLGVVAGAWVGRYDGEVVGACVGNSVGCGDGYELGALVCGGF